MAQLSARAATEWFDAAFPGVSVMAIMRGLGREQSIALADRAWDLGIRLIEVPLQRDEDRRALDALVERGRERDMVVGAGTIVDEATTRSAHESGAAFTVAPGFDARVLELSLQLGMPHLPGVATATEVQTARTHGSVWMKAFPAARLGAAWFQDMTGPFPDVRFVATGGMTAANAAAFLAAGVDVVAVGSAIADESQLPALARAIGARR